MQRNKLGSRQWNNIQRWKGMVHMERNRKDAPHQTRPEKAQYMLSYEDVSRGQEMERPTQQETVPSQALQFIKAELVRTQKSIKDLQSERRLLRKKLSRWTGAVQLLQESQEDNRSKLQAQIQVLAESSECLRTELQQLRDNVQPPNFSPACKAQMAWTPLQGRTPPTVARGIPQHSDLTQESMVRTPQLCESTQWDKAGFTQVEKSICSDPKGWQDIKSKSQCGNDYLRAQNWQTLSHMRQLCQSLNSSTGHQTQGATESGNYPSLEQPPTPKGKVPPRKKLESCSLTLPSEQSQMKEEVELEELVEKLKDALSLQIIPGHIPILRQELLHAAGQVCRTYSDLINKTIETSLT
ncbi:dystrotelin [Discoglossus pictus]